MARYRRGDQIESRLSDHLEVEGTAYSVDLIAKKATGVDGYRVTLSCIEVDGGGSRFVRMEPADTREEVRERAAELADDPAALRELLRGEGA